MHLRSPERSYLCMIDRLTLLRIKLITFFFFFFSSSSSFYLMLPTMGEGKNLTAKSPCSLYAEDAKDGNQWRRIDGDHQEDIDACVNIDTSISGSLEDSTVSNGSSADMADDASSSSTSYSSLLHSAGSLYDLSELRAQLPIKRGLSRFYEGKSQSFTSLSRVTSIEDLPKKESPYRRKMKASKSYGGGLDSYKSYTLPKPTISKKSSRSSLSSLSSSSKSSFINGSSTSSCRSHLIPVQENLKC